MNTKLNNASDVAGMMERLRLGFNIDMAINSRKATQADSDMKLAAATLGLKAKALHLANLIIGRWEPGDSRAVSDEFVALAAAECDLLTPEVEQVLDVAIARYEAMPAPEPRPALAISGATAAMSILVVRDGQPFRGADRAMGEADIVITDRGRIVKARLNVTGSHIDDHGLANADPAGPQETFPQRKDAGQPCGECRLQPDETCDICGARHATPVTIGLDLASGSDTTVTFVGMTLEEYERLTTPVDLPSGAYEALTNNQRQLDADGCEVGVSRQALDELLASWRSLKANEERKDPRIAELSETWTDRRGTVWTPPTVWAYAQACHTRDRRIDESDSLRRELEQLKDSLHWWEDRAVAAERREPNLMAALRCALHYLAEHQLSVKEVQSIVANHPTVLLALGQGGE